MRLYVSNLPWKTTEETFQNLFEGYGKVTACEIVRDKETGRSRGFGFITMGSQADADAAQSALHEYELEGRSIRVEPAKSRPARR